MRKLRIAEEIKKVLKKKAEEDYWYFFIDKIKIATLHYVRSMSKNYYTLSFDREGLNKTLGRNLSSTEVKDMYEESEGRTYKVSDIMEILYG